MKYFLTSLLVCGAITLLSYSSVTKSDAIAEQEADRQTLNTRDNPEQRIQVTRSLTSMPLAFTENQGQWDEQVLFKANAGGATMWFTRDGAYYQFTRSVPGDEPQAGPVDPMYDRIDREPEQYETMMIKATFVGTNSHPAMTGENLLEYKCNYFIGNEPDKWHTDVANYNAIVYEEIYPGIDLKYYGNGTQMEYDFVVSPGADPSRIQITYEGAKSLSVNEFGELVVETDWVTVTEFRPLVYQIDGDSHINIQAEYVILAENTFGFALPKEYNPELALVIDPALSYSTYLGGSGYDPGYGIGVDAAGSAYVTGFTNSSDFPTANAYDPSYNGGDFDVYVTKLSVSSSSLLYSTYLGGGDYDYGYAIAVDAAGSAYVTGLTNSSDFPIANAYDPSYNGGHDAFVTSLSTSGSLIYSTYLGGSGDDVGEGIAVDAAGGAYITGFTVSSDFPTANAYDPSYNGNFDAFVTGLSAGGSSLLYSTYLGGSGYDPGYDIAVDAAGCAYVTGVTWSTDFPTANAYDPSYNGGYYDAFVTSLSAGGSLLYSTYLGGSGKDQSYGIAVDAAGSACVTGWTNSSDFPTANAYDPSYNGGDFDVYVTKLSAGGGSLIYSTYLGGNNWDGGWGIAADAAGSAYVTGFTYSSNFPTADAYDPSFNGHCDVFVTGLSAGGSLIYSTYLGGSGLEEGRGIAVDAAGCACVTGTTHSSDFPRVNAYQSSPRGGGDAFIAKICPCPPPTLVCDGLICDGTGTVNCGGTRDYVYRATVNPDAGAFDAVIIGTHDGNPANYSHICMPAGWTFSIIPTQQNDYTGYTPHGVVSPGPNGTCPYSIVFTYVSGTPLSYAEFGFDHSASPNDVDYELPESADWNAPTGTCKGPVHAPGDSCYACGDVDGDGMCLTATDLSRLTQFVNFGGYTPNPLYECDLNSDGYVDQGDIELFMCYMSSGLSCFPQYPFPTNCHPDTIRGACCEVDTCMIRAPVNCSNHDIDYLGDEVPCSPDPCFADIYGTKFFDANRNEQRDAGEGGLANWKIILRGQVDRTTYTDQNGDYSFLDLPHSGGFPALMYKVSEEGQTGWKQTYPTWPFSYYHLLLNHGDEITGLDFGNWTCDTAGQICCVAPADSLIAWWPLDDTAKHIAKDIGGIYSGNHWELSSSNPMELTSGKSGGAYRFDWVRRAFVRIYNDPFKVIDEGDFTIDAWIYPEKPALEKTYISWCVHATVRPIFTTMLNHRGVKFRIFHCSPTEQGKIVLYMGTDTQNDAAWSNKVVVENAWQHVAVTVSRAQGAPIGTFYHNGSPVGTFTPLEGRLYCPSSQSPLGGYNVVDIGHSPIEIGNGGWGDGSFFGIDEFFSGKIDEVEVFNRALSAQEIFQLYHEDSLGKCDDYCNVPGVLGVCPGQAQATVPLTICNFSTKDISYNWQTVDLCCNNSPRCMHVSFSPAAGTLTVLAGSCRTVDLTFTILPGFTVGDLTCYEVWVEDPLSGEHLYCEGSVVGMMNWCAKPYVSSGDASFRSAADTALAPIDMYEGDSAQIGFTVHNLGDSTGNFDYQIGVVPSCDCDTGTIVSLDNLPLGTNVEGSINIPLGDSASISTFAYLEKFIPFTFQDVVLLADWDDDGLMEPGASIGIHPVIFPDCNANGVHDSIDIAIGTSPDSTGNGIPDECEWKGEACTLCYTSLGEATVTFDSSDGSLTVDNIGFSGEDGILVDLSGASGCEIGLENLDLSTAEAGVAFHIASVLSEGTAAAKQQLQASSVLCTVGLAEAGGMIGIIADYSAIGSDDILVQVYSGGSLAGELTVPGGGSVATCQEGGSGLPSISAIAVDKTDALSFAVTFDRTVEFSLDGGPTVPGDELRLLSVNAAGAVDYLVAMAITGELLGSFTITAIDITSGCCIGLTGNVDADPEDMVDLGDLTALIDYLFISFTPPVCIEEANVDGDPDGIVDLGDLTALIDYLFISFTPPAACL